VPEQGPVRFALIGCGDIGAHNAKALREARGAQLTTIFDPIPVLARDLAERYEATAADSLAAAVSAPDVNAVLVATPHDTHEAVVAAALAAGKHVLLEKPLAADLEAAARIVRMAEESPNVVAVLFPLRTDRRFLRAVEAIEASPEGRPTGAAGTYLSGKPDHYYSGGYSRRAPSTWRQSKAQAGGGVLIMNVLHHLDAVRALIGREAESVIARTTPGVKYPGIEDVATLIVDFGGALATFVGAASAFHGPGERVELWNSSLRIGLLPDGVIAHPDGESTAPAEPEPVARERSRTEFISAFAEGIVNGTQPEVAVRDALAVQAIVTAAYVSAAEDRNVPISEFLPEARAMPTEGDSIPMALHAVAAVKGTPAGSVRVIGDGPLAQQVHRLLARSFGSGQPRAVIETTGSEANVKRAISEVGALGTVVLAAPVDTEVVPVSGYGDIHVRGLKIVALPCGADPPRPT
jgi:predicted dehydrogenase